MIKNILIATAIFAFTVSVLVWADRNTERLNVSQDEYSECVKRETGLTSMQFYQQNGYKLDCK